MNKFKLEIWLLFIAYILPSLLLYSGFLPRQFFFLTLGGFPLITMVIYGFIDKFSPARLGLSLEFPSVQEIFPSTLLILGLGWFFLALLPELLGHPPSLYLELSYYSWYFGMTVFQELVWRGFAFILLEKTVGYQERTVIFWSASLFAFSHIFFRSILILVGTWLLGWLWGRNYWKFRSLSGPVISHYLVGFPFILLNYMGGNQSWSLV
jgi:hypothetical protein